MAEVINDKKVFSLLEVTLSIQRTLAERSTGAYWIKAEMNKLNHYSHSGHCYPELVEKRDGKVIAQMKSTLWKDDYLRINETFLSILKEPIKDGIKILLCAAIHFDPVHGLSLRIIDIDPSFSLGELEREKQTTIERLTREGIFSSNKKLTIALLPQRIAVISVETSKGYSDYLKILEQNPGRYKFHNLLFPSLLQGEKSIASILYQLKQISKVVQHFDAVAIIRGGGGDVGLSSFNNYDLASAVATFPIPVITGIGHSTNETVTEMVSFQNAITPTDLANFLLQKFDQFAMTVARAEEMITERSKRIIREEKVRLFSTVKYFQSVTTNRLAKSHHDIRSAGRIMIQESKFLVSNKRREIEQAKAELEKNVAGQINGHKQVLQSLDKTVSILDPINILKRGFSITLHNGKALKSYKDVNTNDPITTILADGQIISNVKSVKKTE